MFDAFGWLTAIDSRRLYYRWDRYWKQKFGPSCVSLTQAELQVWCVTMLKILYAIWWVARWPCEKTIVREVLDLSVGERFEVCQRAQTQRSRTQLLFLSSTILYGSLIWDFVLCGDDLIRVLFIHDVCPVDQHCVGTASHGFDSQKSHIFKMALSISNIKMFDLNLTLL